MATFARAIIPFRQNTYLCVRQETPATPCSPPPGRGVDGPVHVRCTPANGLVHLLLAHESHQIVAAQQLCGIVGIGDPARPLECSI